MAEIIASTYEIIGNLGAGAGGTVYLANHLRLGKMVVLKADKRKITTNPELLRREVDILKELSHTYIPQVYDFFVENDTVFTVMEFIDGKSIDKYLKNGVVFTQPQVIKWAMQLLEALAYLHSETHGNPPKGYVHSDIKPANIMLRPNGDICLIDFNIALAIGEASFVGSSAGYASPEHYGQDYSTGSDDLSVTYTQQMDADDDSTVTMSAVSMSSSSSSSLKKKIIPDVRSDIYSLGATLYHMLSGKRPAKDALQVEKLSKGSFSEPIVKIITKAMSPNPDLRYQTADEMLSAFRSLWTDDPRVVKHKRRLIIASAFLLMMFAAGGATVFSGMKQMERLQAAQVLAASSSDALSRGDVQSALDKALEGLIDDPGAFDIPYIAQTQLALTNALGVYDLSDSFNAYAVIELPSAPFRIVKSPDESRLIASYAYQMAIYDIESCELIKTLPTVESALCEIEFLSDDIIVYAGKDGLTAYSISADTTLWQGKPATAITVSGDKSVVASIYKTESRINFYDASDGTLISFRELDGMHLNVPENDRFADSMRDVFELNQDGTMCAVSLSGGHMSILDIYNKFNDSYIYETSDYTVFDGEFSDNIFVYSAYKQSESILGIVDTKTNKFLGSISGNAPFTINKYNGEIYASQNDTIVKAEPNTLSQTPVAYTENKNISAFDITENYAISAEDDGYSIFYRGAALLSAQPREPKPDFVLITDSFAALADRNSTSIEILKRKERSEAILLNYDPFISHNEARLSADGSVMLFSIKDFTVINPDGSRRASVTLPESDKIYDQQYRHDGDYLDVIYYSGKVVSYSADDGSIISETEAAIPDEELYEEFETEKYVIKSPLHGTPEVINKDDGKPIAQLRSDDYLTYITESGDYIIAQYISADGGIYGVLMNDKCEEIAYLPNLCDVTEDKLVFDYPDGSIRTSPIYSLEELKGLARNYRN